MYTQYFTQQLIVRTLGILVGFLCLCSISVAQVNFPGGRIALSFDGNQHDLDDVGAMPMSLALIEAAGLKSKVVHIEHSNHVCDNSVSQNNEMKTSAAGLVSRFGYSASVIFDYQSQGTTATANFIAAINASTASDPLWIVAAGPMETVWRALNGAQASKRQYVYVVSHSKWNQNHADCGANNSHTWANMKSNFPEPFYVEACNQTGTPCPASSDNNPNLLPDQNTCNGDNDWESPSSKWAWLQNSSDPDLAWLYTRDKSDGSGTVDVSDAGMTYFIITGGPLNGGDKRAGWAKAKALLENPVGGGGGGDTQAPTTPGAVSASSITQTGVTLSWAGSTDNVGVTGYEVFQNNTLAATVTGTSATLTNLTCNTAYTFKVRAKDAAGNNSAFTANTSITTAVCDTQTCATVRTQAESFTAQSGTKIEENSRLAFINNGDWADYSVNVPCTGTYTFVVRVATEKAGGTLTLKKGATNLGSVAVTTTGSWTTWVNKTVSVTLTEGVQTLRLQFTGSGTGFLYNVDWFEFEKQAAAARKGVATQTVQQSIRLFPNPVENTLTIEGWTKDSSFEIFNIQGRFIKAGTQPTINVSDLQKGMYILRYAGQAYKFIKE